SAPTYEQHPTVPGGGYLGEDAALKVVFGLTVAQMHLLSSRTEPARQHDAATEYARRNWTEEQWLVAQELSTAPRGRFGRRTRIGRALGPWPVWEGTFAELEDYVRLFPKFTDEQRRIAVDMLQEG